MKESKNFTYSLGRRLTLWVTVATVFLVCIATVSLYWSLASALNQEDKLLILDKVQTLAHLLTDDVPQASLKERVEKEWASRKFERIYVRVLDGENQLVTETPDFDSVSESFRSIVPQTMQELESNKEHLDKFKIKSGIEDQAKAFKSVKVLLPDHKMLMIALDRTSEELVLSTYRSRLIFILIFASIVSSWFGFRIARQGMQPILHLTEMAKKITSSTLHERINLNQLPGELAALVKTFNEMLDRLDESFERLSKFSQDIAHDLRTPVNILRGELEVTLGKPRTVNEYQEILNSNLEECVKLSQLIDSLLFLARAENPVSELMIRDLDLKKELNQIADFFEDADFDKKISIKVDVPDELSVKADALLFQRIFANLITNSINYSENTEIFIRAFDRGNSVSVEVEDHGIGISPEDLPKVFDRFYRVEQSRASVPAGTGLGLPIVKGIMLLHKGTVGIKSVLNKGTTVTLNFPH